MRVNITGRAPLARRGEGLAVAAFLSSLALGLSSLSTLTLAAEDSPNWQQVLSVAAYFAEGDFGEPEDTRIAYFPISYELDRGRWGLQLTLPYLRLTGFDSVLVNVGGVTRAVASDVISTRAGSGDAVASLVYRLDPWSASAPFVDFRADVKLPTAAEREALGTGELDYSLQVDVSQSLNQTLAFATLGYTVRGGSPLYVGLKNGAFAQLGAGQPLTDSVDAGIYYEFRESASVLSPEVHELVPYFSWQLDESWSFIGLTSWGLTDASADFAVLGQLRYSW